MQVLLVEDDLQCGQTLMAVLEARHTCRWVRSRAAAHQVWCSGWPELMIIDWMLGRSSGLALCAEAKQRQPTLPVLILSAKNQSTDAIQGLDCGADAYLVKPVSSQLLLHYVQALTRSQQANEQFVKAQHLHHGSLEFDLMSQQLGVGQKQLSLTPKEKVIVRQLFLLRQPTISYQVLFSALASSFPNLGSLRSTISRLRRKLQVLESPIQIQPIYNYGYHITFVAT